MITESARPVQHYLTIYGALHRRFRYPQNATHYVTKTYEFAPAEIRLNWRYFGKLGLDAAGGKRLSMMLTSLYRIMATFRELGFTNEEVRTQTTAEHLAIIDAITSRDAALAASLLGDHIRSSKSRILAIVIRRTTDG